MLRTRPIVLAVLIALICQPSLSRDYERTLFRVPSSLTLPLEKMSPKARQVYLDALLNELKVDYVGNLNEIDTLFGSVSPWLANWTYTTRSPTVVGVWGLTGSGKTSVVKKIVARAQLDTRSVYIDLKHATSDKEESKKAINQLVHMFSPRMIQQREKWSMEPRKMVVILDEFQAARTRSPDGSRISNPLVEFLMQCLGNDGLVSVENGSYGELFSEIDSDQNILKTLSSGGELPYISRLPDAISGDRVKIKAYIRKRLDENQAQLARTSPNVTLDFSQALFVTLGNFPVGFLNGDSVNPESLNAEELKRSTTGMTRTDLTEVLKTLFHQEDLGRLGAEQIIFHSILEDDYRGLLDFVVSDVSTNAKNFGLEIEVSPELKNLLVEKVMMPVLGPRVFIGVLYKTFDSPLLKLKQDLEKQIPSKKRRGNKFLVSVSQDGTTIQWTLQNGSKPFEFTQASLWGDLSAGVWRKQTVAVDAVPSLYTEVLRKARERRLVITAVHEAAHATAVAATQKIVPELVQTDSQSQSAGGLTRLATEVDLDVQFRSDALEVLAIALAGVVGEEMIFGELSLSGTTDLEKANQLAARLFRSGALEAGDSRSMATDVAFKQMGEVPLGFENYRAGVDAVLLEGRKLAKNILERERRFFLELSQKLCEQPAVRTAGLLELVKAHWSDAAVREQILSFSGRENQCAARLRQELDKVRQADQ